MAMEKTYFVLLLQANPEKRKLFTMSFELPSNQNS